MVQCIIQHVQIRSISIRNRKKNVQTDKYRRIALHVFPWSYCDTRLYSIKDSVETFYLRRSALLIMVIYNGRVTCALLTERRTPQSSNGSHCRLQAGKDRKRWKRRTQRERRERESRVLIISSGESFSHHSLHIIYIYSVINYSPDTSPLPPTSSSPGRQWELTTIVNIYIQLSIIV